MPSSAVKALMEHLRNLETRLKDQEAELRDQTNLLTTIATDNVWIKRILAGAAALGFIGKALDLIIK